MVAVDIQVAGAAFAAAVVVLVVVDLAFKPCGAVGVVEVGEGGVDVVPGEFLFERWQGLGMAITLL